jgi:CspA family cold shock protein
MAVGMVKWFDPHKGGGYIQPLAGGPAKFVSVTALQQTGLRELQEEQVVEYDLNSLRGYDTAENLRVVASPSVQANQSPDPSTRREV